MRASQDKNRDMARSILPSRYRSPGREQTKARRRNRRAVHEHLRSIRTIEDVDDWDQDFDCRAYPDAEIGQIVRWRRAGDKLNHFERWAVAITADLPRDDRLSHVRSLLPDGIIGDHALSHLRRLPELQTTNPGHDYPHYFEAYVRRRAAAQRARRVWMDEVEAALYELYDHGGQRPFNQDMQQAFVRPCAPGEPCRHQPRCARRNGPLEPPLIRAKGDIPTVVGEALLVTATTEVLLTHAQRYRSTVDRRRPDGPQRWW